MNRIYLHFVKHKLTHILQVKFAKIMMIYIYFTCLNFLQKISLSRILSQSNAHARARTHKLTHARARTQTYTHTHINTQAHTCTNHTPTHTHMNDTEDLFKDIQ